MHPSLECPHSSSDHAFARNAFPVVMEVPVVELALERVEMEVRVGSCPLAPCKGQKSVRLGTTCMADQGL